MSDLNILKIPGRVKQLRLNIAHKIYYNQAPTYLQTHFNKMNDRGHSTRGRDGNFVVPNVKGAEGNTFYFSAIKELMEQVANVMKDLRKHSLFQKKA